MAPPQSAHATPLYSTPCPPRPAHTPLPTHAHIAGSQNPEAAGRRLRRWWAMPAVPWSVMPRGMVWSRGGVEVIGRRCDADVCPRGGASGSRGCLCCCGGPSSLCSSDPLAHESRITYSQPPVRLPPPPPPHSLLSKPSAEGNVCANLSLGRGLRCPRWWGRAVQRVVITRGTVRSERRPQPPLAHGSVPSQCHTNGARLSVRSSTSS